MRPAHAPDAEWPFDQRRDVIADHSAAAAAAAAVASRIALLPLPG